MTPLIFIYSILFSIITGFVAGLGSNGFADIPALKTVLDAIEELFFTPKI